jgi:hypothetical protein
MEKDRKLQRRERNLKIQRDRELIKQNRTPSIVLIAVLLAMESTQSTTKVGTLDLGTGIEIQNVIALNCKGRR